MKGIRNAEHKWRFQPNNIESLLSIGGTAASKLAERAGQFGAGWGHFGDSLETKHGMNETDRDKARQNWDRSEQNETTYGIERTTRTASHAGGSAPKHR